MDFVFDLLQGAGIAAAIGIRPFLPTLLVGALAAEDLGIDFDGTDFSFLEQPPFLAAVFVLLALSILAVPRDLQTPTRRRLDTEAANALPLYPEGARLVPAGASVLFPPVAVLVIAG